MVRPLQHTMTIRLPGSPTMIRTLALFGVVAFAACQADAQTTVYYREGQRLDPQEVMRILDNVGAAGTTRSIRLLDDAEGIPAQQKAEKSASNALSLPVQFEFDSATISPAARDQLDALAEGIKLLPAGRSVFIEGHTDAIGTDEYNRRLSLRRAESVKDYLVKLHGIDPQRLQAAGFGKQQPIAGVDPYSGANRRVQFRGA
jgi:outer membrane protein OmpA-like peptidoglycan-associated protein